MTQTLIIARPRPRWRRWLLRVAALALAGAVLGAVAVAAAVTVLSEDLPAIRSLADYAPKQSTVVYGVADKVVARFASERRTVVPHARIPRVMVDAVLAAEDSDFYTHTGLDYLGMLRCAVKNAFTGRIACGASTITQQTVKTFLLSPKQTLGRKAREMILAKRVEDALSKDEILFLYLNQIYFGHGAYGVQEAARVYFGKDVDGLEVEEAALLAGLPQSPARLDPYKHPERALSRRGYVLGRLRALGKLDEAAHQRASAAPLSLDWEHADADVDSNSHYAAHVRAELEALVGKDRAADGGLKVYTGLDPEAQRTAERALREGLRALDKRQGWRGPLLHLDADALGGLIERLEARRTKLSAPQVGAVTATTTARGPVIWDLSAAAPGPPGAAELDALVDAARFPRFGLDEVYGGLVTRVDDAAHAAVVSLGGGTEVQLPLKAGLDWARKYDNLRATRRPSAPSEVLRVGDVVLVRALATQRPAPEPPSKRGKKRREGGEAEGRPILTGVLEQTPKVEAALVAMDPATRAVHAMVGGFGVGAGAFNRAVQARRQAGSTFKPVVYAAAFETGQYTPISVCTDAPRVYRDPWTGKAWKPENYGGGFDGEISLRTALTQSKNMCSVELIDHVGVERVLEVAQRVGVKSELPKNLTLALGSGDVTPLEMTNVYATFAAGGTYAEPVFIEKVVDPAGAVLFEAKRAPRLALRPEVAYLTTSLMQSVVEAGTAQRVKALERPVAGKTGTSNEARNAWFIGFTPDLVTGVWVGFDDNAPLGPTETGGRAAIPIWLDFMQEAVKPSPVRDFVVPQGVIFTYVDPKTARLVAPDVAGARSEPFIAGTEPTELSDGTARQPKSFGLDDYP